MVKHLSTILLLAFSMKGYTQTQDSKLKAIGVSIPVIFNNSEGTYYQLGNRVKATGKAVSYGLNITHSRTIYKNLYGIAGIGYFKQSFGIKRPFDYAAPDSTKPLVYTKKYNYNSMHFIIGLGYKVTINESMAFKGSMTYNLFSSFSQKYVTDSYSAGTKQLNKKSIGIGNIISATAGAELKIDRKISVGFDLIIPLSTMWNDDKTFFNYGYADNTQQIGKTKSSLGAAIICNYHF
jgi:hypothetical protein